MSTINDPTLIRELIDNHGWLASDADHEADQRCHRITKYVNQWGGICYGCDFQPGPTAYTPSPFVKSPQVIWELQSTNSNISIA